MSFRNFYDYGDITQNLEVNYVTSYFLIRKTLYCNFYILKTSSAKVDEISQERYSLKRS